MIVNIGKAKILSRMSWIRRKGEVYLSVNQKEISIRELYLPLPYIIDEHLLTTEVSPVIIKSLGEIGFLESYFTS